MHVLGDASLANIMAKIVIEMQYNKLSITFGQNVHISTTGLQHRFLQQRMLLAWHEHSITELELGHIFC